MKKLAAICLILAMVPGLCCFGSAFAAAEEPTVLEHWSKDSPAMKSIVDFVEKSVDETSDGYIPKEDRIAVFDNDGTLYGERFPTYFNDWLYIQRALYDENYEAPEELKAFARAWEDKVLRGVPVEDFDAKERELGPKLYEGLTPDEYDDVVRRFKQLPVWGFEGMTYGEAFFRPMVSLVKYLYDNDYTIYIVSATYRDAVRVLTEGVLDEYVPWDHVIGTDLLYVASGDADKNSMFYELKPEDKLVIAGELFLKNQKTNKATMIQQEIGRMPVLAFGNSTGDFSMATYTLQNEKYGGRAYMLLCDDTDRDYGSPETAASFQQKCDANGFYTVSERDEFDTIYGDGVNMADAAQTEPEAAAEENGAEPAYTLDKVVVLSRHNIRSPLSGSGSMLGDITPHTWFKWTSNPSELSLRGAILETQMGQYFRLWMEDEGLFPENYRPEEGAVRFYANAKQRTQATARYFSAGLLPVASVPVECRAEYDTMDPTFHPMLTFFSDEYAKDVSAQIAEKGGAAGLEGIHAGLLDAIELLMDVTDMDESEAYKSGKFGDLLEDGTTLILGPESEPGMSGPIKTATSVADALTFQYYETADDKAAAFGHDLTRDDWLKIHSIVDTYTGILFETPLIAVNVAHPLLQEIRSELTAEGRKFSFLCGHDSNLASVLSALGVREYELPDTVEPRTPIGVKLVFETWTSEDGRAYAKVRLIYQSTEQLRGMIPLTLDNPPVSFDLDLPGLERNADGFYRLDDVLGCLGNAIDAYDALLETYTGEDVNLPIAA